MIAQLKGQLSFKADRFIILDVSGIGYKINVSSETLKNISTKQAGIINLWTHLAVRENALDLYGFLDKRELEFFELLIAVSGIGPKSAIAILSLAPPDILEKAVVSGDAAYLTKVSGIGRKSAEKIVLELKDKLATLTLPGEGRERLQAEAEAIEALQSLGYTLKESRDALQKLPADFENTGAKVKAALQTLGRK